MAEQPVFTDPSAFQAPVPSAPRVPDASPVFGALGRIGENLQRLGGALYQHEQESAVLRARIGMSKGFQDLVRKAGEAPTFEETQKIFNNGTQEIHNQMLGTGIDARTNETIGNAFEVEGIKAAAEITRIMTAKKADAFLADTTVRIEQIQQDAATNPDPDLKLQMAELTEITDSLWRSGTLTKAKAFAMGIKERKRAFFNYANSVVAADPARGYAMLTAMENGKPVFFPEIESPERRVLTGAALTQMGREDTRQKGRIKAEQDTNAMKMWSIILDPKNNLSRETLEANKDGLRLSDYKEFVKIVTKPPPSEEAMVDDPETVNLLLKEIYHPKSNRTVVRLNILKAHANNNIKGSTASTYLAKNQERINAARVGTPDTPFDRAMSYLHEKLGARTIFSRDDIGLAGRLASATWEFEQFAIANPKASTEQLKSEADRLYESWTLINTEETKIGLRNPYSISNRGGLELKELSRAAYRLQRDKSKMRPGAYRREVKNLAAWRRILLREQQIQTGKRSRGTK